MASTFSSLPHICEVFFIVGLFNSLMALKTNPEPEEKRDAGGDPPAARPTA
ncbi:MAG: hypothetical protein LC800_02710 [Acidobacteria bacterium]|nr:hypothetical protein [Acidobacteriota bacterium]